MHDFLLHEDGGFKPVTRPMKLNSSKSQLAFPKLTLRGHNAFTTEIAQRLKYSAS
jgi:hypothetical protein